AGHCRHPGLHGRSRPRLLNLYEPLCSMIQGAGASGKRLDLLCIRWDNAGNDKAEEPMGLTRRHLLAASVPALALAGRARAAGPTTLRISHQFPGASSDTEGDFRDRLCRRFAAEVEKRTS